MKDIAIENLRSAVTGYTDRAVRYLVDLQDQNDFASAVAHRPVSELLELSDDNPVGWSFYFLKQIIHSINS